MYKLVPFISDKVWGYEQWLVSTHPNGLSYVATDETSSVPLNEVMPSCPILVKIIQANDRLSVQVHPNDEYALLHENSRGKSECWYILEADKNAFLYCGLKDSCTKEQLKEALERGYLDTFLKVHPVKKGDFVYIPAGTVHAIGKGICLLEVQESSDITYRLFDWGRKREMHIEQGINVIDLDSVCPKVAPFNGKFTCEYFAIEEISGEETVSYNQDFILFVMEGGGMMKSDLTGKSMDFNIRDTILCKEADTVHIEGSARLLCIRFPKS